MKRFFLKFILVGVTLTIFTGCATTDAGRTKAEGTGFGALVGAALGAGIGYVTGGSKGALIGAGAGAAAGAGAGYVAGSKVAEKKQEYVEKEDQLDEQINTVAQCNSDLKCYNEQTAARIKDLNKEVAHLKKLQQHRKVKISVLKKKREEIESLIADADQRKTKMNKEMVALNECLNRMNQAQDRAKMAKLGQEVDMLRKQIALLDGHTRQMAKMVSSLSVRK